MDKQATDLLNAEQLAALPATLPAWRFAVQRGGLVVYGGMAAAALGSLVFIKAKRYSYFRIIDIFMPYLALGQALGRIGCFMNGCCFGKVTGSIFSVVFPANSLPYTDHLDKGLIAPGAAHSCAVYPAQLYSSAVDLAIFAALAEIDRRKRWNGKTFWSYLILYPLKRFFIEFVRGDSPALLAGLTEYQLISAGLLCCGIAGYVLFRSKSGVTRSQPCADRCQV